MLVMTNKTLDLAEYVREMVQRHPGLSDRQAAIQAGLANNAVTQIVNRGISRPRPATLESLANTWGTPEDYREMMKRAGYKVPDTPELGGLSPVKQRVVTLLSSELIPDSLAAALAAGLEKFIEEQHRQG